MKRSGIRGGSGGAEGHIESRGSIRGDDGSVRWFTGQGEARGVRAINGDAVDREAGGAGVRYREGFRS